MSVSTESCEGDAALEVEGESSNDSELPLTFIHSITVVPVAVLEPDRDLKRRREVIRTQITKQISRLITLQTTSWIDISVLYL